jgi:hypothetical protein
MRLSLMKGAHADFSSTAWQKIGVKPCFGLEWETTALDPPKDPAFSRAASRLREQINLAQTL